MSAPKDQRLPWSLGPRASVTETPKTLLEEALEQVENYTRRIIDLETRVAKLEAALAKQGDAP